MKTLTLRFFGSLCGGILALGVWSWLPSAKPAKVEAPQTHHLTYVNGVYVASSAHFAELLTPGSWTAAREERDVWSGDVKSKAITITLDTKPSLRKDHP